MELSALHYDCFQFLPSRVAAAAFALGIYSFKVNEHRDKSSDSGWLFNIFLHDYFVLIYNLFQNFIFYFRML